MADNCRTLLFEPPIPVLLIKSEDRYKFWFEWVVTCSTCVPRSFSDTLLRNQNSSVPCNIPGALGDIVLQTRTEFHKIHCSMFATSLQPLASDLRHFLKLGYTLGWRNSEGFLPDFDFRFGCFFPEILGRIFEWWLYSIPPGSNPFFDILI